MRAAASAAVSSLTAATAATMSPTKCTLSMATGAMSRIIGPKNGSRPDCGPKSFLLTTAYTPGCFSAALVSTRSTRACACGLRSRCACACRGRSNPRLYSTCPVTRECASANGTPRPISTGSPLLLVRNPAAPPRGGPPGLLLQQPAPLVESLAGAGRRGDHRAVQRVALPLERGGGVDDHPGGHPQLTVGRGLPDVDPGALGALDDVDAPGRVAARDDGPHHVFHVRDVDVVVDDDRQPVHLHPGAALRGDEARLLAVARVLGLDGDHGHQPVACRWGRPDALDGRHAGPLQLVPDHPGAEVGEEPVVLVRRLALRAAEDDGVVAVVDPLDLDHV